MVAEVVADSGLLLVISELSVAFVETTGEGVISLIELLFILRNRARIFLKKAKNFPTDPLIESKKFEIGDFLVGFKDVADPKSWDLEIEDQGWMDFADMGRFCHVD